MAKPDVPRIAVLGAGPIGLEAALYLRTLGFQVTLYERGRVGEHLQQWGHVTLFSPFALNATPLGRTAILTENSRHTFPADSDCLTGRQHLAVYLEPLARTAVLKGCLRLNTVVVYAARRGMLKEDGPGELRRGQPFRLLLREAKGREQVEEADVVLDCTGTYGQHRWMGDGGIPAVGEMAAEPQIAYGLEDLPGDRRLAYASKNVLVVGAGYSAATTVCSLARLAHDSPETWTVWLARGNSSQPIKRIANDPLRERDRLAVRANTLATRTDGNVEFHKQTVIEAIESAGADRGFRVTTRCAGKPRTWDVDRIIANVGYTPDIGLYRELQIHECYASLGPMVLAAALQKHAGADCLTVPAQGADTLRNPEPNFFILGAKSYGRNAQFLLRNGFEQVRQVGCVLTGKPDLDLYRKN
jgi:thioredoxin reductase